MTEIDSLQISIESNSVVAIAGIKGLAGALEQLKKSGSIGVATKNLKSLSSELKGFTNSSGVGRELSNIAGALEKIKGVGSVRGVANSLSKLGDGLRSIETVNVDSAKIAGIASALGVLSNVKAGGINTMMNGLMKIGKATESLNDEAINAFAERIDKLMDKLTPLSAKMTTVQSGLKAINSNARSAGSSVRQMGEDVNASTLNLSSFINIIQSAVSWLQQAIQKFSEFVQAAVEWDGIHHQFGNAFGEQADEYYEKIVKTTKALKINTQAFMEYSAMSASMLIGFGVKETDAREMGVGYTELAYDIWAAFNNVYKTMDGADGAMAAVRSAIAGEVEPIRRAGFTIVDSQLAITAANHDLAYSTTTATEAQKSYLRYLTLVDQAQQRGVIGTYASEMNKAEGMLRTFRQQLKSLTQEFGSLFVPVLVKVMPYVQAFVELLREGVYWLSGLFGIEIQEVNFSAYKDGAKAVGGVADSASNAADALGEATKKAKELKNATIGIDELNVINPQSATGGSGGGGSGGGAGTGYDIPISSIWDEAIFDNIQSEVDTIKEKLRGWMPVIAGIAAGFAGLRLAKLIIDIDDTAKKLKNIFGGLKVGSGIAGAFKGGVEFFKAAKQMAPEVGWMAALFPKLSGWLASIGTAISTPVLLGIAAAIAAVASAAYFLYKNWEDVKDAVKGFFDENIVPKLKSIKKSFEDMKAAIVDALPPGVIQWFKDFGEWIANAVAAAKEWGKSVDWLKAIGTFFEWLGGIVFSVVGGVIATAFSHVVQVIKGFVGMFSGVVQVVSGFVEFWKAVFTGGDLTTPIKKMVNGVKGYFVGLYDSTIGVVVNLVKTVIDWFTNLWDELVGHSIVPDIVKGIVKWFTDLPKMVFKGIGNFFENLLGKFKGLWTSLVNWWNSKKKLSDYTPNIGSIKDKLSSAWNKAKTWWAESKAKLKEYTPTIGSIKDKLVDAWNKAKEWFNNQSLKLNIKMPHITVGWDYDIPDWQKTVADFLFDKKALPKLNVEWYAAGGFPSEGEFFMAREAGPEMVGKIGNRSAVVNNDQIVEAVSEGVYAAVASAMRATGGNGAQAVNVYLDGKQIYSSVKKTEAERGVTLMGNQLGYTY